MPAMKPIQLAALALALTAAAHAAPPAVPAPPPAAAPAPPDCSGAEHRQFDFWIGDWDVHAGAQLAGRNRIEAVLDGCVLEEHWLGSGGLAGRSFNIYDRSNRGWRQFWVDARGNVLRLEGGLQADGSMLLQSSGEGPRQRIRWTPLDGGDLRQHWESSADGTEWKTVFDGHYRRRPPTP